MSGVAFANNLDVQTTKVLDNRCAGLSTDNNAITYKAPGLLRYETDNDAWKYYDGTNFVTLAETYTGGTGVTINGSNEISIGQSVGTTDTVQFSSLGVNTSPTVSFEVNGESNLRGTSTIDNSVFEERADQTIASTTFTIAPSLHNTKGLIIGYETATVRKYWENIKIVGQERITLQTFNNAIGLPISSTKIEINNTGTTTDDKINYIAPGGHNFYDRETNRNGQIKTGSVYFREDASTDTNEYAKIEAFPDINGGQIGLYTKINGGTLTERMNINDRGLVSIKTDEVGLLISSTDGTTEQSYLFNSTAGAKDFVMDASVGSSASKGIAFRIGGFDKLRIASNGDIDVGNGNIIQASNEWKFQSSVTYFTLISDLLVYSSIRYQYFYGQHVYFYAPVSYPSDDRLKWEEEDITNGLEIVDKLKPQVYWKGKKLNVEPSEEERVRESGFIAQDVEQIPELAHTVSIAEATDQTEATYALNYTQLIAYNVSAIQELHKLVKTLQARIEVLEKE